MYNNFAFFSQTRFYSQYFGAVEVCLNGYWHTVCTEFWDNNDASVVCRQLGFSPYGQFFVCVEWSDPHAVLTGAIGPTSMDQTSSVTRYINDLNCTGSESKLLQCPYNGISNYTCPSNKRDANVYCQGKNGAHYMQPLIMHSFS